MDFVELANFIDELAMKTMDKNYNPEIAIKIHDKKYKIKDIKVVENEITIIGGINDNTKE